MRRRFELGLPALARRFLLPAFLLQALLSAACTGPGVRNFEQLAERHDLLSRQVAGLGFEHRVFVNRPARSGPLARLHVYIDGDGIPWRGRGRPALDPTPRDPLLLRLMTRDPAPAIYLGRPCYIGVFDATRCAPWVWTHGRYGERVVASMVAVLRDEMQGLQVDELRLVGYSGGGTLAMLIAARLDGVVDVVTLAANLDVRAWTEHHGYSPLAGSLDPAQLSPLPARIRQWHWVGRDDRQVPPSVVEHGLRNQGEVTFEVLPRVDHRCCWESLWPRLLRRVGNRAGH